MSSSTPSNSESESEAPNFPSGKYGVACERPVSDDVAAYYDVEVELPVGTPATRIETQAAETIVDAIDGVSTDELVEFGVRLKAMVLGEETQKAVPDGLETITFSRTVRYQYKRDTYEGHIFDLDGESNPFPPSVLILPTKVNGDPLPNPAPQSIKVTAIAAIVDDEDSSC